MSWSSHPSHKYKKHSAAFGIHVEISHKNCKSRDLRLSTQLDSQFLKSSEQSRITSTMKCISAAITWAFISIIHNCRKSLMIFFYQIMLTITYIHISWSSPTLSCPLITTLPPLLLLPVKYQCHQFSPSNK